MLPHDELYHYGVKGMHWGKRKKKLKMDEIGELSNAELLALTPEDTKHLSADDRMTVGILQARAMTGVNAPTVNANVRDRNGKPVLGPPKAETEAKAEAARRKTGRASRAYDRGVQNLSNKKAYQNPPGKNVDLKQISAPMTPVKVNQWKKKYNSFMRKFGLND